MSSDGPAADGEVEDYQVAVTWFGPPEALNTNAGSDSTADSSPQVTTDGAGNWVAVWISADTLGGTIGTDADIFVSRSADAGGTWTAPAPLNTNAGSDSGKDDCAQVTTDALGNWVAVWHSRDSLGGTIGTDSDILVSRSADAGVTWTAPAPLNANAGSDSGWDGWDLHPQVTTDGVGNWVAVWESNTTLGGTIGADNDILVSRSTNAGGTWTAPAPLNTNAASDSGPDWYPQVTTDGAGNWVAGWYSHDSLGRTIGTDDDILVSRSADAGGTWTDPAPLNTNAGSDSGNDRYLQVTTDGAGNWVAVWFSTDSLSGTIGTDNDILFATAFDDRVHIYGTAGDDVIEFDTDGTTHTIKVGATTYVVDHSTDVHIYGQGGHDSIRLYLSAGNEKTYLDMGTVYVDGRPSYEVQADSVETIRVYAGGGNDEAYLTGSDGDDAFYGYQFRSYLHGTGFFNYAWGFDYVEASATSGGATSLDQAWLFDSPGDDTFRADPTAARMDRGTTGTDDAVAIGFDVTRAYASGGADHDEAYLTGSAGDDRFASYETYSYLKDAAGTAFCNVLRQFDYVEASAAGQTTVDRAYLYDSRGGDVFHGDEGNSQMDRGKTGTDDVKALGFEVVKAHSSGGIDEAYLAGSSADDRFFSYLTYSYMQGGTGFYSFAIGFDYVQADVGGTGADFDRGYLYDSSRNDLFTGHTTYGEMISVGRWVKANDFDIGWAVSGAGYHDTATMWSGTLWRLAGDWENVIPHSPPGGAGLPGVDLDFARWLAALEHAKTTSNGDGESGEVNLAGLDYLFKLLGSR